SQKLNPMTSALYRQLVFEHVAATTSGAILDIGCGVGAHRSLFTTQDYVGIDVNADYITAASQIYGDRFLVMDAGAMDFPSDRFDAVFSVATCHHLDDTRVLSMVREGMRILRSGGMMHVVDAVLPVSRSRFKRALFAHDRGRFQRTIFEITALLSSQAR